MNGRILMQLGGALAVGMLAAALLTDVNRPTADASAGPRTSGATGAQSSPVAPPLTPLSDPGTARLRQADGALPMTFDPGEYLILNEGDRATLRIPQVPGELPWQIERRQRHPNGDISLTGHLQGMPGSVVLTMGQRHSFATISANGRIFNMSADPGGAWITNAAELGATDGNDTLQPPLRVPARPRLIPTP